jgi:phosphate/sulfate permease
MFYPFAVHSLVLKDREQSVPVTYGISTLSSVIGATYAMTMMIKWGFTMIILQGIVLYVVLGFAVILYRALRGERALIG